ncbi:hypothetical protein B9Z65_1235 [Elsinoe australis]|uniref:Uncharacterized protein n=1 Tax=Elsinoe australis TaxID=40998 RepID=A0A2P7YQ02_9PEZI|nr:hypothetical protein B9Z65_1235 [Elsinoe australis]
MASITNAPSPVQAIFALDLVTATLAALLLLFATAIVVTRISNGRIRSFERGQGSSQDGKNQAPLKTTLSTHLFLIPALFCLSVAYAIQSAIVSYHSQDDLSIPVTSTFNYQWADASSDGSGRRTSVLSFTQTLATILSTTTALGQPRPPPSLASGTLLIISVIFIFGIAAWAEALTVRGSGRNAQGFATCIDSDRVARILYIVYRAVVVFSSTSVSIQVVMDYSNLNTNGVYHNSERPLLAGFAGVVCPIIWLRNVFIVVDVVLIYQAVSNWSDAVDQALSFLLIVFGELANLTILSMVLWGAWSLGRTAGLSGSHRPGNRSSSYFDA